MKLNLICILLVIAYCCSLCTTGYAQHDNVWIFGDSAGVDFNSGNPVPIKTKFPGGHLDESSASVCDEHGNLLFYTDGSYVWDRYGDTMNNGNNLTGQIPVFAGFVPTHSSAQGTLIAPFRSNKNLYFIFSLTAREQMENSGKLYYSVVDMRLNNGRGAVVPGQKGILLDSLLTEQMTAVLGDRCNFWLLVCSREPEHNIKAFEVADDKVIHQPVVSKGFPNFLSPIDLYGHLAVSPDRKRIAVSKMRPYGKDGVGLFDFDPLTGIVSDYMQILPDHPAGGLCFSPDGQKLYTHSVFYEGNEVINALFQYDLTSGDVNKIVASRTLLKSGPGSSFAGANLKLAPDKKIYFPELVLGGNSRFLSRINFPDRLGNACLVEENALRLVERTSVFTGLPNVIPVISSDTFYHSGALSGPCFANVNKLRIRVPNDITSWDYLWSTGSTAASITADTPGIYWLQYKSTPCDLNIDTFVISFPNGVLPSLIIDTPCFNMPNGKVFATTYTTDTVQYYYTWLDTSGTTISFTDTLNQVPAGDYELRIRTAQCDTNIFFTIPHINPAVAFIADTLVCAGTEVMFQNISDPYYQQFFWDFGDSTYTQASDPAHRYTQAGKYTVSLSAKGPRCSAAITAVLEVDGRYHNVFVPDADSICMGEAITFSPQWQGYTTTHAHWDFGDGKELTTSELLQVQHAYDQEGVLAVKLRSKFRVCPDSSYIDTIYVFAPPAVDVGKSGSLCLNGPVVELKNQSIIGPGPHNYLWNTGDTMDRIYVHQPGTYSLYLSTPPLGCVSVATITVVKDCYVDIPNAFTPNGDGYNDYFFPRQLLSSGLSSFQLQVWNKWGQVIFETWDNMGRGWDGTLNGIPQPVGVYPYKITLKYFDNKEETYYGNVTLLR